MKCYYHPAVEAVATCANCGKAICQACSVDVAGRLICQQCLASGSAARFQTQPTKPTNTLAIVSCYIHPDREPVGTCTSCGRPICRECAVEMQNKLVCRECLSTGKATPLPISARPLKDRGIALILEILPGLFGLLGLGWIYSGNTKKGVTWLVVVLVWDMFALSIVAATAGFGLCFTIPANITMVAISALSLSTYTKQHPELFGA